MNASCPVSAHLISARFFSLACRPPVHMRKKTSLTGLGNLILPISSGPKSLERLVPTYYHDGDRYTRLLSQFYGWVWQPVFGSLSTRMRTTIHSVQTTLPPSKRHQVELNFKILVPSVALISRFATFHIHCRQNYMAKSFFTVNFGHRYVTIFVSVLTLKIIYSDHMEGTWLQIVKITGSRRRFEKKTFSF